MSKGSWAASGRRAAAGARGARPDGSWWAAVDRARESWDMLTGGPNVDGGPDVAPGELVAVADGLPSRLVYSDTAAAAILSTALGLWADSAARMAPDPE